MTSQISSKGSPWRAAARFAVDSIVPRRRHKRKLREARRLIQRLKMQNDALAQREQQHSADLAKANDKLVAEINSRKMAQDISRQSEERYRFLLESVTDYICSVSVKNGKAVSTVHGPGCLAVTGYSSEEYLANPLLWHRMIHDDDKARVTAIAESICLGQSAEPFEHRIIHKNGSVRWLSNTPVLRRNSEGEVVSYDSLIADITPRKQAEEQLEGRVIERTRELVEANRHIQQAQADLVQAEKMSMLGQLVAGVAHEINTPTGAIMNVSADAVSRIKGLANAAADAAKLDSQEVEWLRNAAMNMLEQKTSIAEHIDRDLLGRLCKELEAHGATAGREAAELAVLCGMRSIDALAAKCLDYEAVRSFLDNMAAIRNCAEIANASVHKISRIVKALRYYSRSGQGEVFDIDINESIDNTLVILQNRIKHLAQVQRDYQQPLPRIKIGPEISQVWTNIISNACDAIEDSHKTEPAMLRISTRCEEKMLTVEIYNDGPAIPPAVMEKLFDPFFTTKPIGKGTGLGLSICARILRKYQGTICPANVDGGVIFKVELPIGIDAHGPAQRTSRSAGGEIQDACTRISL